MFFDDRLATVLRHRAAGEHAARTQFRQLLDLLGSRKYGRDESLVAAAWLRLGALGEMIPASERAAMIRESGWRFRSAELAAHLAEDEPEVASAALSRADLAEDDWEELIPRLPIRARGFLRLRRDLPEGAERILDRLGISDRALPLPATAGLTGDDELILDEHQITAPIELEEQTAEDDAGVAPDPVALSESEPEPAPTNPSPAARKVAEEKTEISALVERIAQFRKDRENPDLASDLPGEMSPQLPLEDADSARSRKLTSFAFTTDAAGRIEWADDVAAPMVIGHRLMQRQILGDPVSADPVASRFLTHQPIENVAINLEGAEPISGGWVIDARPRFAPVGGRFFGYIGRFRRPVGGDDAQSATASEADRIRQLLHELRTPVNALQGFAEVIQQQLFGPAPNEYRALAATIAGDAARILAGFDELERLARLESGVLELGDGTSDLGELVQRMVTQLQQVLAPRMAGFDYAPPEQSDIIASLAEEDAEALLWRLFATTAGACKSGETLSARLFCRNDQVHLIIGLPAQLAAEEDVFSAAVKAVSAGLSAGLFGAGFSLRLARAEARSAGGDLIQDKAELHLKLPLLIELARLPKQPVEENKRSDMQ